MFALLTILTKVVAGAVIAAYDTAHAALTENQNSETEEEYDATE